MSAVFSLFLAGIGEPFTLHFLCSCLSVWVPALVATVRSYIRTCMYVSKYVRTSCRDLGLDLFGSSVVSRDGVCLQIVQGVLDCVRRERAGETVDRGLLRSIIHMFQDLQVGCVRGVRVCVRACVCVCMRLCLHVGVCLSGCESGCLACVPVNSV